MSSAQLVVIDCGASRVALGAFSWERGGLRCDRLELEVLPTAPAAEDRWLQHTTEALRSLGAKNASHGPAVLVLPPHAILLKQVNVPPVEPARRDQVVRFAVEESIPDAAEAVWGAVASGHHEAGEAWLVAAAKLGVVIPLCAAAHAGGFEVGAVLPSVLAIRAAGELARPGDDDRLLVLNVGARSATLLQVDGPSFAARSWSLVGRPTANPEPAPEAGILAAQLARETTRSLMHFQRQTGLQPPTRMMLAGGVTRTAGLPALLAAKLSLPVEALQMATTLEMAPGAATVAPTFPGLAELVGAATLHWLPGQATMNLLPPSLRRREQLRQRQPWLIATALLLLGTLVPPMVYYHGTAVAARSDSAALEETLVPLRAREARNRAGLEQLGKFRQDVAELQLVQARRTAWLRFFADLQVRLTQVEDVWLENLQTVPAANDVPMKLVISGRMLDRTNPQAKVSPETFTRVKALLAGLAESPFVSAVEGERFDNSRPGILKFDFVLVTAPLHPL